MNYVIRNEDEEEMKINFSGTTLSNFLESNYGYIYDSMKANGYEINLDGFNLFFELIHDKKVVGFATYYVTQASTMTLTDTFVLPDFKSKNLLFKNFSLINQSGSIISILKPTRDMVELLVKNNFAAKLTDSIVTSAISFDMLEEDILGDFNLKGVTPSTNLYELNLCSPIFLYDISTPGVCNILYQNYHPLDDKKYNCAKFRNSINIDEYFLEIKKTFLENSDEFNQKLSDLKDSIPKSFLDYDEIIGSSDDLSDYFEDMIEDGMVDRKTAIKIRNQLKREYENGEVTDEALALRVSFLLSEDYYWDKMTALDDVAEQFDYFCGYCHSQVSVSGRYCQTCGYDLSGDGLMSLEDIKNK